MKKAEEKVKMKKHATFDCCEVEKRCSRLQEIPEVDVLSYIIHGQHTHTQQQSDNMNITATLNVW